MQRSTVEQDLAMLGDVGSVNAYADYNKRSTELGALADSQESLIDDAYDALFAEAAAVFPPIGTRAAKAKQLWDDAQKLAEDPGAALRD
jgi:acyl carrier protein phosphodiesterase